MCNEASPSFSNDVPSTESAKRCILIAVNLGCTFYRAQIFYSPIRGFFRLRLTETLPETGHTSCNTPRSDRLADDRSLNRPIGEASEATRS
jgi:hypothetical protein